MYPSSKASVTKQDSECISSAFTQEEPNVRNPWVPHEGVLPGGLPALLKPSSTQQGGDDGALASSAAGRQSLSHRWMVLQEPALAALPDSDPLAVSSE